MAQYNFYNVNNLVIYIVPAIAPMLFSGAIQCNIRGNPICLNDAKN